MAIEPTSRPVAASQMTKVGSRPLDHASAVNATNTRASSRWYGTGTGIQRAISGSQHAAAIAGASASRGRRRTTVPSVSGGSGGGIGRNNGTAMLPRLYGAGDRSAWPGRRGSRGTGRLAMPDRSHPADGVRWYRPAGDAVGYAVRTEHVRITLDDGARLAATLYVPDGPGPFPTVLESIPYRKDDWTFSRDWPLHGAFAAAGYVSCRLAGPGDPGGLADRARRGGRDDIARLRVRRTRSSFGTRGPRVRDRRALPGDGGGRVRGLPSRRDDPLPARVPARPRGRRRCRHDARLGR